MRRQSDPVIIHTLPKEPHVTCFAKGNVNTCTPTSLACSPNHGVFVGDPSLHAVYRIQHGNVSELVPPSENPVAGDFNDISPTSMAYHHIRESLIVADSLHHVIREISLSEDSSEVAYGAVSTFAGSSDHLRSKSGYKEGSSLTCRFSSPSGVCVTLWGDVLVSDTNNDVIRLIRHDRVCTFAGNGSRGFRDGPKHSARFHGPLGIVSNAQGDVFVCDSGNRRVRLIDESGEVSTVAGSGEEGLNDGPHLSAQFFNPERLCLTDRGDIVVVGHHIRLIQMDGIVTTFAECSEAYTQRHTELESLQTLKRPFTRRLFDILTLRSIMTEAPSHVVVPSRRSSERKIKPRFDPAYNIQKDAEKFVEPHEPLGWIGDVLLTTDGDLLLANPNNQCVKQIQGALSLLYPLKKMKPTHADTSTEAGTFQPSAAASSTSPPTALKHSHLEPSCSLGMLIESYNPLFDYELTLPTKGGETTTWMLHAIVLFLACPSLLLDATVRALSKLRSSATSIQTLLRYIYSGQLPMEPKPPLFWAELALVTRTVNLNSLAQYCCYRTYQTLQFEDSIDTALSLLGELPMATQIFEAISEFISTKREFSATSTNAIKRRLSLSDALPGIDLVTSTKLRPPPVPPSSLSSSLSAIPSPSPDLRFDEKADYSSHLAIQPTLHPSKSSPMLIGRCLTDPSTIASRVVDHSLFLQSSDRKMHEKNKVDPYGLLQDQLPMLGALLRNPPPHKDSLVPFPELLAPDFYLHVEEEYVPCHACVLYARWPWFRTQIDQMGFVKQQQKIAKPIFAPFSPGHSSPPSSAIYTPARRMTTSFVSNASTVSSPISSLQIPPSPPQRRLSMIESISLRASKTFQRDRSVEIPPNTLGPECTAGLVWYLYSGEVHKIPPHCVNMALVANAQLFGFIDSLGEPNPPFQRLVEFIRSSLNKPITLENCFAVLNASRQRGNKDQVDRAKIFISNHVGAIFERKDMLKDFYKIPIEERDDILNHVPISLPTPTMSKRSSSSSFSDATASGGGGEEQASSSLLHRRHPTATTDVTSTTTQSPTPTQLLSTSSVSSSSWSEGGEGGGGRHTRASSQRSASLESHQFRTLAAYRHHASECDEEKSSEDEYSDCRCGIDNSTEKEESANQPDGAAWFTPPSYGCE